MKREGRTVGVGIAGLRVLLAGIAIAAAASPAFASRYHAAIAYDARTGASGRVVDAPTQADADRKALDACRRTGTACQVVLRFADTCAAYASGTGGAWGYKTGAWTRRVAESTAVRECRRYGSGCAVVASACTSPPPNYGSGWTPDGQPMPPTLHDTMRDDCHARGGMFSGARCYVGGEDVTR